MAAKSPPRFRLWLLLLHPAVGPAKAEREGQPSLETSRLALRPLMVKDPLSLREPANTPKIADACVWIPHSCSKGLAQCWIRRAAERYAAGTGADFGIHPKYRVSNPASGRVLAKLGFKQEGLMRQCVSKGQGFEDMVLAALLKEEWQQLCRQRQVA